MNKKMIWLSVILILIALSAAVSVSAAAGDAAPTAAVQTVEGDFPSIVSISPGSNGFTIKWTAYDGAYQYRLFMRKSGQWVKVGDTAATSFNHLGLKDQAAYTYTVRAMDKAGGYLSKFYARGWKKIYLSAPVITSAAPCGDAVKLTWNPVKDVDSYIVYRRADNQWKEAAFVTGTSYSDAKVISGKGYAYTVRGISADRREFLTAYSLDGVIARFVAVPRVTKTESLTGFIRLTWSAVDGAQKYRVFCRSDAGWMPFADTGATVIRYPVDASDTTVTFTVRALDADGKYVSDFYRPGWTQKYLDAPTLVSVENTADGQMIKWKAVPGAERYKVFRRNGSSWKTVGTTDQSSFIAGGVKKNTEYTYTVRCISADGSAIHSFYDQSGLTMTFIEMPAVNACENRPTGTLISWNPIDDVNTYRVFVRDSKNKWKKLEDVSGPRCFDTGVEDGKTSTYTVRAIDYAGNYLSSYDPLGYTNTYYAPPVLTSVNAAKGKTVLTWQPQENITAYRVYRREFGGAWKRFKYDYKTAVTDIAAPKNTVYQYTLRALDAAGNPVSDYKTDNLWYYNGAPANGKITVQGHTVSFTKGVCDGGYVSVQDIIRTAEAEVGTKATPVKVCKYNTWYYNVEVSGEGYDWCAVFVDWVFNERGAYKLLYNETASCGVMGLGFQQNKRLISSGYKPGDLLFFHWDDSPSYFVPGKYSLDHVGIIAAVNNDGSYTTIEGNTGSSNDGEVMLCTRYPEQISCAGRPVYGFFTSSGKAKSGVTATGSLSGLSGGDCFAGIPAGGEYHMRQSGWANSNQNE